MNGRNGIPVFEAVRHQVHDYLRGDVFRDPERAKGAIVVICLFVEMIGAGFIFLGLLLK